MCDVPEGRPARAGKAEILRHAFPRAAYALLEDPEVLMRLRSDPRAFVEGLRPPVILDEVQNAPELFAYVRSRIDLGPRKTGQWFLNRSQEAPLIRGVTESMAGRLATFALLPFSTVESPDVAGAALLPGVRAFGVQDLVRARSAPSPGA